MRKVAVQIRDPRQFQLPSLKVHRQRDGDARIAYISCRVPRQRTGKDRVRIVLDKTGSLLIQTWEQPWLMIITLPFVASEANVANPCALSFFPYRFNHHSILAQSRPLAPPIVPFIFIIYARGRVTTFQLTAASSILFSAVPILRPFPTGFLFASPYPFRPRKPVRRRFFVYASSRAN